MVALGRTISPALLAVALVGCQWVPRGQYDAAKTQNRLLQQQSRAQQSEIENLKIHNRNVEDQLIRSEEELARVDLKARDRLAARGDRRTGPTGRLAPGASILSPAVSDRLLDLARKHPSLQYDAQSGVSKLETDVQFESGRAVLSPESEQVVGQLAQVLKAPEARQMKVMVVGHTDRRGIKGRDLRERYPTNWHLSAARAVAVAERLRSAGIPEERMGVAGFAQHQPVAAADTADALRQNRRVEIFLVGPDTPVVGWHDQRSTAVR
jgi:chemotaxis protein MotB